ncbi:M48 family metallopeptidase [Acidovorax sp. SUPP1855]|uniref:M48 family metallopeptidase n=1 Tax=Acidovorax sp. SUPP1855 TaxID=431774 RepID=UPI0023DE40FC|nr:M48 family metallopeptidase [Acidovorax sp. SUPP1855]GKS83797.1 M48 family metallopeptidase [Acidovorax sp. SUPP1855]
MALHPSLRAGLGKAFLWSVLSLFAVPLVTLFFANHVQRDLDARFLVAIESRIDAATDLSPANRQEQKDYYRAHPPSTICTDRTPDAQEYREAMCPPYSNNWQFFVARTVALWTLVAGALVLVAALALGALAFVNRRLQHASFVAGWRLMTAASALEVVVQGAMVAWLSFWVTAYFWHRYSPKLIMAVAIGVAVAVVLAVVGIFKRVNRHSEVEGELVQEADAPLLWQRIRHMAARLQTAPPQHIVAGIDANFFVTEAPIHVAGQVLTGRTLFVSIPLLRLLDQSEADAVFAHELAHLGGGDTESSARLGPKLVQYDQYHHAMRTSGLTAVVSPLLGLYRLIFEWALARDSRAREFQADRIAAQLVSPQAIGQSLVKIAAYARYRHKIESDLFDKEEQLAGDLGIAHFISSVLPPYAQSAEFRTAMQTANVPHPFDTHPLMPERIRNVGWVLPESDYGAIVVRPPERTWAQDILTADAIEQRLWSDYEQAFAQGHERSLAYRYEPATAEELAVVLKYFPARQFALKGGHTVQVSHEGITTSADGTTVPWDAVKAMAFKDSILGDSLTITHPEKSLLRAKSTKLKLPGLKKDKQRFKATLEHYWERHQVMRGRETLDD